MEIHTKPNKRVGLVNDPLTHGGSSGNLTVVVSSSLHCLDVIIRSEADFPLYNCSDIRSFVGLKLSSFDFYMISQRDYRYCFACPWLRLLHWKVVLLVCLFLLCHEGEICRFFNFFNWMNERSRWTWLFDFYKVNLVNLDCEFMSLET